MNDWTPKPGQILLFMKKPGFDPFGSFITAEERDTDVCHAAFIGPINTNFFWLFSTGVEKKLGLPWFYGTTNGVEYCKGRDFYVCEFSGLTDRQAFIMFGNGNRMRGMMYGLYKVVLLVQRSKFGGVVHRLYPWLTKVVAHPFCSEAVADCCWKAGNKICAVDEAGNLWKEEPSAISPSNIKTWAGMKNTNLNIVATIRNYQP